MNFIAKNLGWLLLLLFFIFMLFVISSSGSTKNISNSGALSLSGASIEEGTGATASGLEELVEKINTDGENNTDNNIDKENSIVGEEKNISEIVSNETETVEITEKDAPGFFSRIFSRKGEIDQTGEDKQISSSGGSLGDSESTSNEIIAAVNGEEKGNDKVIQESTKDLIVKSSPQTQNTQSKGNLQKNKTAKKASYDYNLVKKYVPEVLNTSTSISNLPGVNLETKVGNNYEIGVHSLKINNKSFTQKLGYLMKGDVITQLTPENSYGCFQMKVLRSSVNESNEKTGYVCKKYLSETSESPEVQVSHSSTEEMPIVENTEVSVPASVENPTSIGDIITVERPGILLNNTILVPGDILDQMSETSTYGCFTARVHMSVNIESVGKVGKVCNAQLY